MGQNDGNQKVLNKAPEKKKYEYVANAVHEEGDTTFWTRVGVAFKNKPREDGRDGGYTILLNAVPTNGKLILSPPLPEKEQD